MSDLLNHAYTLRGAFINISDNFQNLGLSDGAERNLDGKITRKDLEKHQDSYDPEKLMQKEWKNSLQAEKKQKKEIEAKIEKEQAKNKDEFDLVKISELNYKLFLITTKMDKLKADLMAHPPQMKQILEKDTFNLLSSACPCEKDGTGIDSEGQAHPGLTFDDLMVLTTNPRKGENRPSFKDIYIKQDPAFNNVVIDKMLDAKKARDNMDSDVGANSSGVKTCFEYPDNAFIPKNTEEAKERFKDGLKMITSRIKDFYNL